MQHNENSTFDSFTDLINTTTRPSEERYVLDHWAFKFFSYFFGIAFGIFSLCCLVFIVRQCKQPSSSRSIHSRFTTVQLFVAAALKEVALFWSPLLLDGETTEKKQTQRYMGKFERPNLTGRKFEPTFIFTK